MKTEEIGASDASASQRPSRQTTKWIQWHTHTHTGTDTLRCRVCALSSKWKMRRGWRIAGTANNSAGLWMWTALRLRRPRDFFDDATRRMKRSAHTHTHTRRFSLLIKTVCRDQVSLPLVDYAASKCGHFVIAPHSDSAISSKRASAPSLFSRLLILLQNWNKFHLKEENLSYLKIIF